jgi:hypothetical protein
MSSAASQATQMQAALADLEAAMLEASANPGRFHELAGRRDRMRAELVRLEMSARREAAEGERAQRQR